MTVEQVAESVVGRPHPLLAPFVDGYTGYRHRGFPAGDHVGLPSRHVTFVLAFDEPLDVTVHPQGRPVSHRFAALVGGLHTRPALIHHDGNQHGIQLHVTPAGARALFGFPAREVAGDVIDLAAVWGPLTGELLERLTSATTWSARFATLDRILLRVGSGRAEAPSGMRDETAGAWRQLVASAGRVDVRSLAGEVGWSRRHLTQRFTDEFGLGPKEMARVLRFERSKRLFTRRDPPTLATIAASCGFADQAHMAREWRRFAGASPTRWLAAEQLPVGPAADDDTRPA